MQTEQLLSLAKEILWHHDIIDEIISVMWYDLNREYKKKSHLTRIISFTSWTIWNTLTQESQWQLQLIVDNEK
jgi:predicted branched-subunit amino acid permease